MIYSYNKSQQDALFLKFILIKTLHVSDRSTVHQESLNTVYTAIGICHPEILMVGKITSVYACTL